MKNTTSKLQGITVRSGRATMTFEGDLGINRAAELLESARVVVADPKVKEVCVILPEGEGIPLAAYQVLKSMEQTLAGVGKALTVKGTVAPFGGRPW